MALLTRGGGTRCSSSHSDEPTLAAIRRGLDDLAGSEVVSLDEVRAEHAARARS
jgi:hypothetical protein